MRAARRQPGHLPHEPGDLLLVREFRPVLSGRALPIIANSAHSAYASSRPSGGVSPASAAAVAAHSLASAS